MKQDVIIINCARGALIDTDALIDGITTEYDRIKIKILSRLDEVDRSEKKTVDEKHRKNGQIAQYDT